MFDQNKSNSVAARSRSWPFFVVLIILAILHYKECFSYWFLYDDPAAMMGSTESVAEIVLFYRLHSIFYNPLWPLSFKPDFLLWGLNPWPYHIHNFIVLLLVSYAVFRVLRLFNIAHVPSLLAAGFIIFSAPAFVMVSWLTLRLYLYSSLFGLAALEIFVRSEEKRIPRNQSVLLICTLLELSFLGKEQFLTLPFLLFVVARGSLKDRVAKCFPFFLVLIAHLLLRHYVLQGKGGYTGMAFDWRSYFLSMLTSLLSTSELLFATKAVVVFALIILLREKRKRFLASVAAWAVVLAVQFLTLSEPSSDYSLRYWFVPVILVASAVAASISAVQTTLLRYALTALIVSLFLLRQHQLGGELRSFLRAESDQSRLLSKALIDRAFNRSFMTVSNDTFTSSGFLQAMDSIYFLKSMDTYLSAGPRELLAFFPEITNYLSLLEIDNGSIKQSTNALPDYGKKGLAEYSRVRPQMEIIGDSVLFQCPAKTRTISFLQIVRTSGSNKNFYCTKATSGYPEEKGLKVDLRHIFRGSRVELRPMEALRFDAHRRWVLDDRELQPREWIWFFFCRFANGEVSPASTGLLQVSRN